MADVEVLEVRPGQAKVRAGHVIFNFHKRTDGRIFSSGRYSYDRKDNLWVSAPLYLKAVRKAGAVISEKEREQRRIRRKREIQLPLPGVSIF